MVFNLNFEEGEIFNVNLFWLDQDSYQFIGSYFGVFIGSPNS